MHLISAFRSTTMPVTVAILVTVFIGALIPFQPMISAVMALALLAIAFLLATRITLRQLILGSVLMVILGYLFAGRGFAYVGLGPLYIGEFVLAATAIVAATSPRQRQSVVPVILASVFIILGILRTLPFVEEYGLHAIRDAALYYYILVGVFLYFALTEKEVRWGLRIIGEAIPFYLAWSFIQLGNDVVGFLPDLYWPGAPVGILETKPGDRAVVLAAIAAYTLLGLPKLLGVRFQVPSVIFWSSWIGLAAVAAIGARGGLLAIVIALCVVVGYRRSRELFRMLLIGGVMLTVLIAWNPSIQIGSYRELSVEQFTANLTSIFQSSEANSGSVDQNRDWRLEFWKSTTSDTIHGDHLWFGMGYGVNLANEAGFQINENDDLRSPHNVFVTVLGRMGVIGLGLWVALLSSFGYVLLRAASITRRTGDETVSAVMVFGLSYSAAVMMNAFFDVYLEGPQGAIPFWGAFGAILVLVASTQADRKRGEAGFG